MKTNAQYVREHRERKRAVILFSDVSLAIQKRIAEDLQFSLAYNENGKLIITWDMDESIKDFLQGYAAAKGLTFDELMDKFNMAIKAIEKARPGTYIRALYKAARRN